MKICSLLPSATEIIAALGLAEQLVGKSHECDFPPEVCTTPVMVSPAILSDHCTSQEIDEQVRATVTSGKNLYILNKDLLQQAKPDVIITQALCQVCALTPKQIDEAIEGLSSKPQLITLNPRNLNEVLDDIDRIGAATNRKAQALALRTALTGRIQQVQSTISHLDHPRVACIEWLDPLYVAGHWVPDMVALAGGIDVLGKRGQPSRIIQWEELIQASPDIIVFMPCGFSIDRSRSAFHQAEKAFDWSSLSAIQADQAFFVDASSYFSRPGPRLIDGLEILASTFHPTEFGSRPISQLQPINLPTEHRPA